jgi:hypothetical protein
MSEWLEVFDEGFLPRIPPPLIVTPAQAGAQSREHGFRDNTEVLKH